MLRIQNRSVKRILLPYGITVSAVAVAYLARLALTEYVGPGLPTYVTFYPAIILAAIVFGFWAGLLATAIVAVISAHWILPPEGFAVGRLSDLVGLCLFSVMGVLISVVAEFYRRSRQRAQEMSLELTKANETLRHLSSKLLSAQEDERKRIASEIHDNLGACLNAIKFKIEGSLRRIGAECEGETSESFKSVVPLVQEGIEECRRMQQDLRPSILDDLGLSATFSWFSRRFQTIYSTIRIEQEIDIREDELSNDLKVVIYRVLQEAMNNIAKHSGAELVHLSLRKVDGRMELTIRDNGQGFDLEKISSQEATKKGLGLTSMRERVELSGGSFTIESAEKKGTITRASWPLQHFNQ